MDTPKALFAGLALIAVAILFNGFMQPRYTIAGGAGWAWVMDTKTGMFRGCNGGTEGCQHWIDVTQLPLAPK